MGVRGGSLSTNDVTGGPEFAFAIEMGWDINTDLV